MDNATIKKQVISLVSQQWKKLDTAEASITEKIKFNMRNVIRQCRKNYAGVFDSEMDKMTGKKKIWIPLTESIVESVVKNIDLDSKNVETIAKKPDAYKFNLVVRGAIRNFLDTINFGELLNNLIRALTIDGTAIIKTLETKDANGKIVPDISVVNLLNFYISPNANNIQDADWVMERILMTTEEIKKHKDWLDTEGLGTQDNLNVNDPDLKDDNPVPLRDVWECYGMIPKSFISGDDDNKTMVNGRVIVSGLEVNDSRVHVVELNTDKILESKEIKKPYEECWFTRYPNRWHGRGIAEKLIMIQSWLNTVVNIRIMRSMVSTLGLFKIKDNAGITPQMISRLAVNGAIKVQNMDDIEQMIIQDVSQSSYSEETNIQEWARSVTQAYESVTGEMMPASMPATNAAIQSKSAMSAFDLIRENVGLFLERWIKRHLLPIIIKNLKQEDILRITGDAGELEELDNMIAENKTSNAMFDNAMNAWQMANVDDEMAKFKKELKSTGSDRYFSGLDLDMLQHDIKVNVSNEDVDSSVLLPNLVNILAVAPEYREPIIRKVFDILGEDFEPVQPAQSPQGVPQGMPQQSTPNMNPNQAFTQANTL